MAGALLDTHALYWLVSGEREISSRALDRIAESQAVRRLYVSPITAWELSIASLKPSRRQPPVLSLTAAAWFRAAVRAIGATVVPIGPAIAVEAAEVPNATGHKDPGDCFLIATARSRRVPIVTRDPAVLALAAGGYLDAVAC